MFRPIAFKAPVSDKKAAPSDSRLSQSQFPVWNYQQYGPPTAPYGFGYDPSFSPQTQHRMPQYLDPTHNPEMDTARAEFQLASARARQAQRDEAVLLEVDDGESSQEESGPGEDDLSDADVGAEEVDLAGSLGTVQDSDLLLKKLAGPDDTEFDFSLLDGSNLDGSSNRSRQRIGRKKAFRRHTGPRKAAEPTPDIMLRTSRANQLYIAKDLDGAKDEIFEIIRINAETLHAWETLAAIFIDQDKPGHAALAYYTAAHLTPKIDRGWIRCIDYALGLEGLLRRKGLGLAESACSAMVRAIPNDLEARMKKAAVQVENGKLKRAISQYLWILKRDPMKISALQKLAEVCVDAGDVNIAIQEYRNSLVHLRAPNNESEVVFGWEDADAYITLYELASQYDTAISELKSIARWLLGREEDIFWDGFTVDDREWDMNDMRRSQVPAFGQGKHPQQAYGLGLPLEFRVKLGLYRLHLGQYDEAMAHLNVLHGPDEDDSLVYDYPYLFRQAGDQLYAAGRGQAAMKFYQPLKQIPEEADSPLLVQIGRCFLAVSDDLKAAESFKAAIEIYDGDVAARMELARMYERIKQPGTAFNYVTEIIQLKNNVRPEPNSQRLEVAGDAPRLKEATRYRSIKAGASRVSKERVPRAVQPPRNQSYKDDVILTAEYLQGQYQLLKLEQGAMRAGDVNSSLEWMDAAKALTDDFRSFKTFYPWDKYIRFLGYSGNVRLQAETSLDSDITAMAERLSKNLGAENPNKASISPGEIPKDYRGISFRKWLDIFLDYALCLARNGQPKAAYEICEAAKDAIVFYHSREDMFLIQLCWSMCALIASDEETCVSVVRFFMKDYQFTTDSYRMFAAVSRACHSPVSWYNSGPTQKFILRQIKLMDFSLVSENKRQKHYADKGSYSAQDQKGHLIVNTEMDIALLMLYGHILFTGGSYTYALNYFFRAYALDPPNPMINLNIGLAYVHHALKRQTENRQHSIIQGISFMRVYYESRSQSSRLEIRQEAHYNMARAYHMLGLVHLAIPFYRSVLDETSIDPERPTHEDLAVDTAYNLQVIYAMSGNHELADEVTRQWLVI